MRTAKVRDKLPMKAAGRNDRSGGGSSLPDRSAAAWPVTGLAHQPRVTSRLAFQVHIQRISYSRDEEKSKG
jgi:hypothetical protein